jgi:predicted O-methyltransferase YrrM
MELEQVLSDPPPVHQHLEGAPQGVWSTERSCYEFIAAHVGQGSVTLETGCGVSTAVLAILGCQHTSVFLDAVEGRQLEAWADERSVSLDHVTLLPGGSDAVLPTLESPPCDLVFIDGCHGYPFPEMDWFFGARHLRRGGILIVDDVQLWAPRQLANYLDADARWSRLAGTRKWSAWRRESDGGLSEEFYDQPFGEIPAYPKWRLWLYAHVTKPAKARLSSLRRN